MDYIDDHAIKNVTRIHASWHDGRTLCGVKVTESWVGDIGSAEVTCLACIDSMDADEGFRQYKEHGQPDTFRYAGKNFIYTFFNEHGGNGR